MDSVDQKLVAPASVVQINHENGRNGWIGAFVTVTEVRKWGVIGFVHIMDTHDLSGRAYIRLKWEEIDYIGMAKLIPKDELPDEEQKNEVCRKEA